MARSNKPKEDPEAVHVGPNGESFKTDATTGAGSIVRGGGGYAPAKPDPMVARLHEAHKAAPAESAEEAE